MSAPCCLNVCGRGGQVPAATETPVVKFTCEWRVSQKERLGRSNLTLDVEQKTDIYAFALNDILKFKLQDLRNL